MLNTRCLSKASLHASGGEEHLTHYAPFTAVSTHVTFTTLAQNISERSEDVAKIISLKVMFTTDKYFSWVKQDRQGDCYFVSTINADDVRLRTFSVRNQMYIDLYPTTGLAFAESPIQRRRLGLRVNLATEIYVGNIKSYNNSRLLTVSSEFRLYLGLGRHPPGSQYTDTIRMISLLTQLRTVKPGQCLCTQHSSLFG